MNSRPMVVGAENELLTQEEHRADRSFLIERPYSLARQHSLVSNQSH